MNQIETVRLRPADPAQLVAWLERFNEAANWLSGVAFQERLWHWLPLQRRAYHELRDRFQLPSAAALVAIRKVAYAYRNRKRRHHQARFRRRGAIPVYAHRYKRDGTVSLYGFRIPFGPPAGTAVQPSSGGAVLSARQVHPASGRRGGRPDTRRGVRLPGLRPGDDEPADGQRR